MMNETETRTNLINPKLKQSGWVIPNLREEYPIKDGRKLVGNKRASTLKADYLLKFNNTHLAFIEAKHEALSPTEGLEQVKNYATLLRLNIAYSTNGHKIYEFDMVAGKGQYIDNFPTPEALYERLFGNQNSLVQKLLSIPLLNLEGKQERYYQEIAIRKTMEAIADGQKRILLTLATGTGKTYVAFQIANKLHQAKWTADGKDHRPKILFLADRNILADQAINAFNHFDKDIVKITGKEIKKRGGKAPMERNFYFAIYQAISDRKNESVTILPDDDKLVHGIPPEDDEDVVDGFYKLYEPDFFDVIIIDECHRGVANDKGSWRKILNYFQSALHIGLTATPKHSDNADTYKYFGEPVYKYSLIDGINDGFLTPYKVLRLKTNLDTYRPDGNDTVVSGSVEKEEYSLSDFERNLTIPERTDFIAQQLLNHINEFDKTIVFCVNQTHAAEMRDAINKYKKNSDKNYCVRITSNDGDVGRELLETFKNSDKIMPNIVTSSQMLTTGVDILNVRNVVLIRQINSMTEFKQIIGRGTRLYEGKDFFTIIDFTGATALFQDPLWDGDLRPEIPTVEEPKLPYTPKPRDGKPTDGIDEDGEGKSEILTIQLNGKKIEIASKQYFYVNANGQTLDAEAYLREIMGHLPAIFKDETQLRQVWQNPQTRKGFIKKLEAEGLSGEQLAEFKRLLKAENCDIIDVLAYLQYNAELTTYTERVLLAKGNEAFFERYKDQRAKNFLYFILEQYERYGVKELDTENLSELIKKSQFAGNRQDALKAFGGNVQHLQTAFVDLQKILFA